MNHKFSLRFFCCAVLFLCLLLMAACGGSGDTAEPGASAPSAPLTVTVAVPEGTCSTQIASLLEENGVCAASEFLSAVNNPENLALLPVTLTEQDERAFLLEGYIFPDTYEFYTDCSGQAALERFLENTRVKLTQTYQTRAEELGFTMDEVLSIASIIQEEAGNPVNMPMVSSVIHNRLQSSRYPYLQCDVAIRYLEDYVKPYFSPEQYDTITYAYNINSKRKGLPAGPITNPGTDAIEAALYPADSDYYFFVTDSEENYYYAETWEGHKQNCHTAGIAGY